jgi:hypothetical protein
MKTPDIIEQCLNEAAHSLGVPLARRDEPHTWWLAFDTATLLDVEYHAGPQRVVIQGDIGQVAPDARLRLYEIFLEYNYLWPETGGVRMALDGAGNTAVMLADLHASELETSKLCSVLRNMADIQRAWRQILLETGDSGDIGAIADRTTDAANALASAPAVSKSHTSLPL